MLSQDGPRWTSCCPSRRPSQGHPAPAGTPAQDPLCCWHRHERKDWATLSVPRSGPAPDSRAPFLGRVWYPGGATFPLFAGQCGASPGREAPLPTCLLLCEARELSKVTAQLRHPGSPDVWCKSTTCPQPLCMAAPETTLCARSPAPQAPGGGEGCQRWGAHTHTHCGENSRAGRSPGCRDQAGKGLGLRERLPRSPAPQKCLLTAGSCDILGPGVLPARSQARCSGTPGRPQRPAHQWGRVGVPGPGPPG